MSDHTTMELMTVVAKLRQQDQLVFRMSQCQSWETMRPIFAELLRDTMSRMNAESDRIRALLVPEIRRVYAQPTQEDPSPHGHPRLAGPRDASNVDPIRQLDKPTDVGNDET